MNNVDAKELPSSPADAAKATAFDKLPLPDTTAEQQTIKEIGLIRNGLGIPADVVEYPCSGPRNIWEGFKDSRRVIHIDTDPRAIEALKDLKERQGITSLEAYETDAATYDPGEPVDVLVLLNSYVLYPPLTNHLKDDGYIICNNYFGDATELRHDPRFELVAVTTQEGSEKTKVLDTNPKNFDLYFQPVENDSELQDHPGREMLIATLQRETGQVPDDVFTAYSQLLAAQRPDDALLLKTDLDGINAYRDSVQMFAPPGAPPLTDDEARQGILEHNKQILRLELNSRTASLPPIPAKKTGSFFVYRYKKPEDKPLVNTP